jgi:hypothetical protein
MCWLDGAGSGKLYKSSGVIMDENMSFSEHGDVMVGKNFAMLGFIRKLSFESRDSYSLKSL